MLMRGKTVVITGGTSGIGEVAAIELAKMGARIVLIARDNARGKSRSRKSAQDDKWNFCLMAGTLWPANQERP
jgi:NAD(P)-dependent dehydrogenase (short-subunit alcohol dehydrogenase family)